MTYEIFPCVARVRFGGSDGRILRRIRHRPSNFDECRRGCLRDSVRGNRGIPFPSVLPSPWIFANRARNNGDWDPPRQNNNNNNKYTANAAARTRILRVLFFLFVFFLRGPRSVKPINFHADIDADHDNGGGGRNNVASSQTSESVSWSVS